MALVINPPDPMAVSQTNEFRSVRANLTINCVMYLGVSTTSLAASLSIETQSFNELRILPVKSKCKFELSNGKISV